MSSAAPTRQSRRKHGASSEDSSHPTIYKVETDELTICLESANQNRPKEFTGKAGSGSILEVWRRVKPQTAN